MKKFTLHSFLVAVFCSLFVLANAQTSLTFDVNAFIGGTNRCKTGPLEIELGIYGKVNNAPVGQFPFHLEFSELGSPTATKDTLIDSGINMTLKYLLSGPGVHIVQVIGSTIISGQTYVDTVVFGVEYGTKPCFTVSGKVHLDKNDNCQFDAGDEGISGYKFMVGYQPGELITTDVNGDYSFMLAENDWFGTQIPELIPNGSGKYNKLKCPSENYLSAQIYQDTIINIVYKDSATSSKAVPFVYVSRMNENPCTKPVAYSFYVIDSTNVSEYGVEFNFGDGSDTSYIKPHIQQQSQEVYHTYHNAGTYYVEIKLIFEDTTIVLHPKDPIYVADTCGSVSGKVFTDLNGNCIFNTGVDQARNGQMIRCTYGASEQYTYSDSAGNYYFEVPINTPYEVKLMGVDSNGYTIYYGAGLHACQVKYEKNQPESGLNFGFKCESTGRDFIVGMSSWGLRPGFVGYLQPRVINKGCEKQGGTLSLTLANLEMYIESNPAPDRISGKTLEWDFVGVGAEADLRPEVKVKVDSTAIIGDTICHYLIATPLAGDLNPNNNETKHCPVVRGSYDPNDKSVYQAKSGNLGDKIPANDNELLYQIRFQNMGTDTAFNIYVLDTLDDKLELESFRVLDSSHPLKTFVNDNRTVRFQFDNILLPDDKINEPLSHGYIVYAITPKKGLPFGTVITNTANIFFDFNLPIVTNTTESEIVNVTGVQEIGRKGSTFKVFPNPATNQLNIITNQTDVASVKLIDMIGKTLVETSILNQGVVSLEQIPAGIYVLTIQVNGYSETAKVVISK